jgi:putative MFS transporter
MRAATPNARALQPFSFNPTGTLLRRHLAHFVAAVDIDRGYTLSHSIMFMLTSSVGMPLGAIISAWLADKFQRKYSVFVGMMVWAAAFAMIAVVSNVFVIYACVFLLTVALGFVIPLMYTLTNESFPTRARSTGVSLTDGLGHLGGAVGPVVATMLYAFGGPEYGFASVFILIAATALAAALPMLLSTEATRQSLGGTKKAIPVTVKIAALTK